MVSGTRKIRQFSYKSHNYHIHIYYQEQNLMNIILQTIIINYILSKNINNIIQVLINY